MVFKAPLSKLRQRTTELVDQITGATLPAEVHQEEKRMRDEKRKWKCGACRVTFAGQRELTKVSSVERDRDRARLAGHPSSPA